MKYTKLLKCWFYVPAPFIVDPRNEVFPVARAPSKLALLKFACPKQNNIPSIEDRDYNVSGF